MDKGKSLLLYFWVYICAGIGVDLGRFFGGGGYGVYIDMKLMQK